MTQRYFAADSFWNTPIEDNPVIDPRNEHFISLLKKDGLGGWGINLHQWTIPVYETNASTHCYDIAVRSIPDDLLAQYGLSKWVGVGDRFGHGPGFGQNVPIPDAAIPDPEEDAHFAIVDWEKKKIWDMWACKKNEDGSWESNTGMVYDLDGSGVFDDIDFGIQNGESIHFYGPSRAAGVPAIAGLIMHDEVVAGEINHKLACATWVNALKEHVWPATWTDGFVPGGIPEGAVIQLDPELDLDQFDFLPGERAVAKTMQVYGMVDVDNARGNALYGEGLWGKPELSWDGLLTPHGLENIPLDSFRVLKVGDTIKMGDTDRVTPDEARLVTVLE